VLLALTRRFVLDNDVDLAMLAAACPVTLSGADLYALCADAWMNAFKRTVFMTHGTGNDADTDGGGIEGGRGDKQHQQQHQQQKLGQGPGGSPAVTVTHADFTAALAALTPSLSADELARYLALKRHYDAQQSIGLSAPAAQGTLACVATEPDSRALEATGEQRSSALLPLPLTACGSSSSSIAPVLNGNRPGAEKEAEKDAACSDSRIGSSSGVPPPPLPSPSPSSPQPPPLAIAAHEPVVDAAAAAGAAAGAAAAGAAAAAAAQRPSPGLPRAVPLLGSLNGSSSSSDSGSSSSYSGGR
jgi:hypothetical protein